MGDHQHGQADPAEQEGEVACRADGGGWKRVAMVPVVAMFAVPRS
jgi:hypothetical protein